MKAHSRFGEEGDHHPHHHAHKPHVDPPLNAEEQALLVRLKTLPFGTWFEIRQEGQKERLRRKLSWFSTLTGRCLFVNQRGVRVEERTLDALAREVVRGTARVVEAQKESLIDRAWNAIVASLRQFGGKPATAAAATGVVKP